MEEKESGDKVVIGASLVGGVAGALFFGNPVGAAALAILAATGASPAKAKDEIVPEVATSPLSVVASPPPVAAQKTSAAVPAAPGSASAASEAMSGRQVAELSSKLSELESQLSASSAPSAALRAKEEEVAMLTTKLTVNEAKLADLQAQLAALKSGAPAAEAAPADGASSAMAAMEAEADRVILEIQLVFTGRSVSASLPATSTTDALSLEARRLLGLQGQGISLLVNGVRLAPGVPLTKTKVLSYANDEVVTENVVVLTSARGEFWQLPSAEPSSPETPLINDAGSAMAAMEAEAERTVLDVQVIYDGRSVCATLPAASTTDSLATEAERLLGLQGQGISLLVNGVRLAPGVPLTKTKVLSYANDEVVTENVVVLTSARGEKWKAPAGKMAAETVAAMAAEEAARTVLDVQIVYNGRSVCASLPAASTTDALVREAERLLGLQGQGISLLVNGVGLSPGVPLTSTPVLTTYANNEVVTENVVVLTRGA